MTNIKTESQVINNLLLDQWSWNADDLCHRRVVGEDQP